MTSGKIVCNMFCPIKRLNETKVKFVLMEFYLCKEWRNISINIGYNYVPRGNAEDIGTLNVIFFLISDVQCVLTHSSAD